MRDIFKIKDEIKITVIFIFKDEGLKNDADKAL